MSQPSTESCRAFMGESSGNAGEDMMVHGARIDMVTDFLVTRMKGQLIKGPEASKSFGQYGVPDSDIEHASLCAQSMPGGNCPFLDFVATNGDVMVYPKSLSD